MRIVLLGVVIAVVGCGKPSKAERCDKAYAQIMQMAAEMAKAFGGEADDADQPTAEDKQKFIAMCSKLPDDALDCVTDMKKAMTPRCAGIMEKAEADAAKHAPSVAIAWESVEIDHKRATASVPKGWKHETFMGDVFLPPDDAGLGMFTRYQVGSACGGTCDKEPATEWAKRFDENEAAAVKVGEIIKDEPVGDSGRLVVGRVKQGGKAITVVVLGQWSDGGEIYFVCKAELEPRIAGAVDDFEQACRAMKVASFSASY